MAQVESALSEAPVPAADAAPELAIRGVHKRFGGVQALKGVSLTVPAGSALAVIGPNGAGKSTLLKAVSGVHRPDRGEVWLGRTRLDRLPPHRITHAGIALAHQVPRPFPELSVHDNVRVAAVSRSARAAPVTVEEVLHLCELDTKAQRPAGSLAVLDLKRLEVARALATDPTVLMLDEVAAGLVGRQLDEAIALIRRVHATGRTVLLVEHVERVVREVVDRVLVLDWGEAIAEGTPEEIARDPKVREVYLGDGQTAKAADRRPIPATGRPVLSVRGLTAAYGGMVALREVSLEVAPGEIVAVLGANGAGKSTLCGAIMGAVKIREGIVRIGGDDVTRTPSHQRARSGVAYCPEGRRVFAELTVRENLLLGAPLRSSAGVLDQRLAVVYDAFPVLRERSAQLGGTLSGGQQQMLAVGRALMAEPRLLICDEISLGLSPVAVDTLYEALARVNQSGVAILLVEQNVHRCLTLADRAVVLSRGRLSYTGAADDLLRGTRLDDAYFGSGDPAGIDTTRVSTADTRRTT
ncbi:ATP-binding cassette domain-containing protein [Actinoplanes sp. NPDC026670]|uniref:ATP-binding cassette domain-containing protein n=1 Tax=Actinoplanes sp. NPDC026670 TaxID=3154700 RepID=UPI0033E5B18B